MEHHYYFSCLAEQPLAWISTLFLILLSSLIFLQRRLRRPKLNLPPGPRPIPIIGNLNRIGTQVHHSIHALATEYGPLMQLWFGSERVVVASSMEMAHAFLKTHDQTFASRPVTAAAKYTSNNFSDMLWSPYGSFWRQSRKIFSSELFTNKRIDSYEYMRVEEREVFVRVLFLSKGKPITLRDHLLDLTSNIIMRMLFGKKYPKKSSSSNDSLGDYTSEDIKELVNEWFRLNSVVILGDLIPWLGFLDFQGHIKKMKAFAKKLDHFLEHVLNEHIERRKTEGPDFMAKDIVDQLLLHFDDDGTNNDVEEKLERQQVKGLSWVIVLGAMETTAVTIEWAFSELLKNPEILKKATDELDRVVGKNRWVEESDRVKLPYIEATIKEAMRLHPATPLLTPRFTTQDIKIGGYDIPKGTRGLVSSWTLSRDPKHWDNPQEFYPDRFIEKDVDVKGQDLKFIPFGSGRRMCPGYVPGLKVIQLTLANLLHGFKWELPSGVRREDLDMEDVFGITTCMKTPIVAVAAEARLPPHLYSPSM